VPFEVKRNQQAADLLTPQLANIAVAVCRRTIQGLVAVILSCRVQQLWLRGDYDRAYSTSNMTRNFAIASYVLGAMTLIVALSSTRAGVNSNDTMHNNMNNNTNDGKLAPP
jgi:Interferon-induced transmembrane protein